MEKEQKQELGWRVSVFIPAFHHCEPLCAACTQCTVECRIGMGNTDTLHPNSCFCSFSIPTSEIFRIKFLLLVIIQGICITALKKVYTKKKNNSQLLLTTVLPHTCMHYTASVTSGGAGAFASPAGRRQVPTLPQ